MNKNGYSEGYNKKKIYIYCISLTSISLHQARLLPLMDNNMETFEKYLTKTKSLKQQKKNSLSHTNLNINPNHTKISMSHTTKTYTERVWHQQANLKIKKKKIRKKK